MGNPCIPQSAIVSLINDLPWQESLAGVVDANSDIAELRSGLAPLEEKYA